MLEAIERLYRRIMMMIGIGKVATGNDSGVIILTAAVDTQDNRLELKIQGWGEGMERWMIDYHVIHGDPALPATWDALDEILKTPLLLFPSFPDVKSGA